jgi:hypothetical protein
MHIFDIATMKCLQTLDTAPNTNGVMAFSADEVSFLDKKYHLLHRKFASSDLRTTPSIIV